VYAKHLRSACAVHYSVGMETETRKTVDVTITVQVDVQAWCDEYGTTPGQVRKEVTGFLYNAAAVSSVPMYRPSR